VYGKTAPSPAYAETVARLLAGTCATESHLRWRRQGNFNLVRLDGAWGLWQTEQGAVKDSVKYLRRRGDVLANCAQFVDMTGVFEMDIRALLMRIMEDDRFAVVFARLHYLRVASPVPSGLTEQAAYYKKYYNTVAGKGSVEKYLRDWRRLVEPAL
jgi:hypothetical protein